MVAGSSGLLVPVLYLTFDEINPRLSQSHRALSEVLDNLVVFLLPAYIIFELAWLVTGTVWTFGASGVSDPSGCARSVYVFSAVVVVNFWLHALTPLAFMLWICCTRIFPYCSYCAYWNIFKTALDNWNRQAVFCNVR